MKKSKLLQLISSFSNKELKDFQYFVASPYFNKKKELTYLLDYLKKGIVDKNSSELLDRHFVFSSLFPKQSYDDKQLNYMMSQLFQLGERFLSIQGLEKDGIQADYYLLEKYVNRKLEKLYTLAYQRAEKKLTKSPYQSSKEQYQYFLLSDIANQHFQQKEKQEYDAYLEKATNHLDQFYFSNKLKYLVTMLAWEKIIAHNFNKKMMHEIINLVGLYDLKKEFQINIYYQLLMMFTQKNTEKHYWKLKEILINTTQLIPTQEVKTIYSFMSNYCNEKIRFGNTSFSEEMMLIYVKGLEDGFFLENNIVSPRIFKNMVKLGISVNKFDMVEHFISNYANKLPNDKQEDASHYSMAEVYEAQKNYTKAIYYLNKVEFTDVHYSLNAKELLLRIYYQINEDDAFESLIFSFKIYLKRNKLITRDVKSAYENFVRFIHQLKKYGKKRVAEVEEKIHANQLVVARTWLLEQVDIIKNSK